MLVGSSHVASRFDGAQAVPFTCWPYISGIGAAYRKTHLKSGVIIFNDGVTFVAPQRNRNYGKCDAPPNWNVIATCTLESKFIYWDSMIRDVVGNASWPITRPHLTACKCCYSFSGPGQFFFGNLENEEGHYVYGLANSEEMASILKRTFQKWNANPDKVKAVLTEVSQVPIFVHFIFTLLVCGFLLCAY